MNIAKYRWTEDEEFEIFQQLASKLTPKDAVEVEKPVSLAEIWTEEADSGFKGLSSGYKEIDKLTQGMAPGQVHVYFGDTGHGKSQVTQNIAVRVAETGVPVLFNGLEMTKEENRDRFKDFGAKPTTPIYQPPRIDLDYKSLESSIAAEKYGLVVIDHLHMFENAGQDNEANFLSAVCREVKMLAIKYDVPIILVSHINEDKLRSGIPKLSDLKGSSSIKQIADVAIAVYNEGMVYDEPLEPDVLKLALRKNRRGIKTRLGKLRIMPNARLEDDFMSAFPVSEPR